MHITEISYSPRTKNGINDNANWELCSFFFHEDPYFINLIDTAVSYLKGP
jgi:hypothetical protein